MMQQPIESQDLLTTAGLLSICPQTEMKDHPASLWVTHG